MLNERFRKIRTDELTPGEKILIRGKVSYSHIASHIDGDELETDKVRRRQANRPVIEKPYVTITVSEARVLYKDKRADGDPDRRTVAETYVEQRLYKSMKSTRPGMSFTAISKSPSLPWLGELRNSNVVARMGPAKKELVPGLDVTVVMSVFSTPFGNGVGLNGVISNAPITYEKDELDLSAYGLIVVPMDGEKEPSQA